MRASLEKDNPAKSVLKIAGAMVGPFIGSELVLVLAAATNKEHSFRHISYPRTNFVITLVGARRVESQLYQVQRFDRRLR